MNCISESRLQAYLDRELNTIDKAEVELHLSGCEACQNLLEKMTENEQFTSDKVGHFLSGLDLQSNMTFSTPVNTIERTRGVKPYMKAYKKYAITAAAAVILVVGFTVEPVKAAVSDAVSIFRANHIATMDISLEDLSALERGLSQNAGNIDIENLAQVQTTGGESKNVSLEAAQNGVTFQLDEVSGLKNAQIQDIFLTESSEMTFTLNVEKVNGLMKTLGATKFFDESLSGKPFSIYTPGTVSRHYLLNNGTDTKYITYVQTKFPEITAPAGTSVSELTEAIASLGILPSNLQSQIKSMADVSHTLYLPNINGSLETIEIAGTTYFAQFNAEHDYDNHVIWSKDGSIHIMSGQFSQDEFTKMIMGE